MSPLYIHTLLIAFVFCICCRARETGHEDGDVIIEGFFPIHEQPQPNNDNNHICGPVREEYGIQRVEAMLQTIEEINNDTNFLPNIKLGVEIRDTCWNSAIALEDSVEIVKNKILTHKNKNTSLNKTKRNLDIRKKPIIALVGPASSEVALSVRNLLKLFKIPLISYSATSIFLNKQNDSLDYFARVVPSDTYQVKVIIDLINHFKWEYVSLVFSQGIYGISGAKELWDKFNVTENVCVRDPIIVNINDNDETMRSNIKGLDQNSGAKVCICFCEGEIVTKVLKAMVELNMTKKGYLFIGTEGWADRNSILKDIINSNGTTYNIREAAAGAITIRLRSRRLKTFDEYFKSRPMVHRANNPWFMEYWEHKFKCSSQMSTRRKHNKTCTGEELSSLDINQDSKLEYVVKATKIIALALNNYIKKYPIIKTNHDFIQINGTLFYQEIFMVEFNYEGQAFKFDSKGDPPPQYEIMNYVKIKNETTGKFSYKYVKVGEWNHFLTISEDIQWPENENNSNLIISICSEPCKNNERKIYREKMCCWKCERCNNEQYVKKSIIETCEYCERGNKQSLNGTSCIEIPALFIQWTEVSSIIVVIFSCIGIFISLIITVIFAKFNNTSVVKSSTRELMYIILFGIILSYLTPITLLYKPSLFPCALTRIFPGLSFSLIYGALVIKTNRIYRILDISKKKIKYRKGRFLNIFSQIVMVLILNLIELTLIALMVWSEPPGIHIDKKYRLSPTLLCNTSMNTMFIPLSFDAILVGLCTWYAFKTRNLPANFNEAKYIGFTMYNTCVIWISLLVVYYYTDFKIISLCLAINISSSIVIIFLFLPKVWVMIFRPEKNQRSAFITTTDIQCHIGSVNTLNQLPKINESSPLILKKQMELKGLVSIESDSRGKSSESGVCYLNIKNELENEIKIRNTNKKRNEFPLMMEFLHSLSDKFDVDFDTLNSVQINKLRFLEDNLSDENFLQST